jgi:hypothetical protein
MLSPETHVHVLWWGLEFVVPAEPASPTTETPRQFDGTAPSMLAVQPSASAVDSASSSPPLSPPAELAVAVNVSLQRTTVAHGAAQRPERSLLCDAARLTRTGVQLL